MMPSPCRHPFDAIASALAISLALAALPACHGASPAQGQGAAPAGATGAKEQHDCTADYPMLPLAELPPPVRREFCRFAQDNFCYCGCPHMLSGCLKEHPACPHASRMAAVALAELASGVTAEAASQLVLGYYDSFKPQSRATIDVSKLPCQGPANAKLTLVEFSDFDCPHCKAARPLLEELVHSRPDVRLCFMSFPLHPHSGLAADAAAYALEKGQFWRYHDLLFEDQEARASMDETAYVAELERLGGKLGLDPAGLSAAIHDPKIQQLIDAQRDLGRSLGVDGTPFVFVNGRKLPPISPDFLKLTIDDEIEWMGNGGAWAKD
ncbi:MAG: DsbA family protein [Deltaproteobacteria bacterium]